MDDKWYSKGLSEEEAKRIGETYAKIERPVYGITDGDYLALQFILSLANTKVIYVELTELDDIKQLLSRTKSFEVSKLEGKVVEAYVDRVELIGLSVNENLI